MQTAKYTSPSKSTQQYSSLLSPQVSKDVSSNLPTRRVWIKKLDGTPTSILIKENAIVDDLKLMIIDRFPTTLAKIVDPSDIIIKFDMNISNPGTPAKKFFSSNSSTADNNMVKSPIPIVANKFNLESKPILNNNLTSIRSNSPKSASIFEPDKSVWSILDTFFPNGMAIDNAFIITVPNHLYSQLQSTSPYSSTFTNTNTNNINQFQFNQPTTKKIFPNETIAETKEEDHHDHRRLSSLPNQHNIRSQTPSSYRRSFSNSTEHPSTVLLLPSNQQEKIVQKDTDELSISPDKTSSPIKDIKNLNPKPLIKNLPIRPHSRNTKIGGSSTMAKVLPSINVLIVEDNLVNSRILSAHLRRHSIHYDTAKNGKEAIEKWRKGGFHLVLMDIQLPVLSGLDASREIRRLEKINHIGVFAKEDLETLPIKNKEDELDLKVFRSPIIIVALTASTLKQDKQEALAAGCNDYLTKPVNLDWLLNKITEWGCMQALIDFDGWKSGERMTNISAAIPTLTRKSSSRVKN